MNYEIELTKERAEYLAQELKKWDIDARITESTENWATVEVFDDIEADDLIVYAFNMGVSYGRLNNKD